MTRLSWVFLSVSNHHTKETAEIPITADNMTRHEAWGFIVRVFREYGLGMGA